MDRALSSSPGARASIAVLLAAFSCACSSGTGSSTGAPEAGGASSGGTASEGGLPGTNGGNAGNGASSAGGTGVSSGGASNNIGSGGMTRSSGANSGGTTASGGAMTGGGLGAGGASAAGTGGDSGSPNAMKMTAAVNVHDYPKPTAYGFVAADGGDRMGNALVALGVTAVRGPTLGATTFLQRLHDFGVKEVILGLSASAHGKPFDPATVGPALDESLAVTTALGMTVQVEGLNEWDLFHSRSYNAGVLPSGMSDRDFVAFTQKALFDAAHARGIRVIGPSIGHPADATSQAYFPDVSADVDIVNAHLYFTSSPESLDLPALVAVHTAFQGTGKPVWITETGIASYGSVTTTAQADVIRRGLAIYSASGLIDRLYDYELLDDHLPGWDGTAFNTDNAEYHFGLYAYDGTAKPAAAPFHDYVVTP